MTNNAGNDGRTGGTDDIAAIGDYRELVRDTTINETTLLSTDYLNHFNEVVMLLDITADMPEMLDEVAQWKPKSYQEHFRESTFRHKDLAVAAFSIAPAAYRFPLQNTVAEINAMIAAGLPKLTDAARRLAEDGDGERFRFECLGLVETVRARLEHASAIINGAIRDETRAPEDPVEEVMDQSSIDALFD